MTSMIADEPAAKASTAWLRSQAMLAEAAPGGMVEWGRAGALLSFTTSPIAALNGVLDVATPPRHRRHGYARAITRSILNDAYTSGRHIAFLSPTPAGLPLYESLGFRIAQHFTRFTAP